MKPFGLFLEREWRYTAISHPWDAERKGMDLFADLLRDWLRDKPEWLLRKPRQRRP